MIRILKKDTFFVLFCAILKFRHLSNIMGAKIMKGVFAFFKQTYLHQYIFLQAGKNIYEVPEDQHKMIETILEAAIVGKPLSAKAQDMTANAIHDDIDRKGKKEQDQVEEEEEQDEEEEGNHTPHSKLHTVTCSNFRKVN